VQIQRERPDGRFPLCEFQVHTERFTKQAQVLGKPRGEASASWGHSSRRSTRLRTPNFCSSIFSLFMATLPCPWNYCDLRILADATEDAFNRQLPHLLGTFRLEHTVAEQSAVRHRVRLLI